MMSEQKCAVCKLPLTDSDAYEYRGFISCGEHFDQLIEKVDIRRSEIIKRNDAITAPLKGLDISTDSVVGAYNRKLLAPVIETCSKEIVAEKQYRGGIL